MASPQNFSGPRSLGKGWQTIEKFVLGYKVRKNYMHIPALESVQAKEVFKDLGRLWYLSFPGS